jgi:hypothetical protein
MSIHRVSLSLAGLLLIGATSAYAQAPGMICGTVTDPLGTGASGVTVTLALTREPETPPTTATTNAKGDYLFPSVPVGTYTLSFTLDGFKTTVRANLIVTAGFGVRIDQQLQVGGVDGEIGKGYPPQVDVKKYTPTNGPQPMKGCTAPR